MFDHRKPYLCHVVYPKEIQQRPSFYSFFIDPYREDRLSFGVSLANGDFGAKGHAEPQVWPHGTNHDRIDADFLVLKDDPDTVYLVAVNKFRVQQEEQVKDPAWLDSFMAEVENYIFRMQQGEVINFVRRKQDIKGEEFRTISDLADVFFQINNNVEDRPGHMIVRYEAQPPYDDYPGRRYEEDMEWGPQGPFWSSHGDLTP